MRACRLSVLLAAALALYFGSTTPAGDEKRIARDEDILRAAKLATDGNALLKVLKDRSLTEEDEEEVHRLIGKLGAQVFKVREKAAAALVARGPVIAELLREAIASPDPEVSRRAERCLKQVKERDLSPEVLASVVRLTAARKPAGAAEALLAFLPFVDHPMVAEEARTALAVVTVRDGKPEKCVVAALADKSPVRRGAAAEALLRAKVNDEQPAVRKLLRDPDVGVRLRVAVSLVHAQDREAVQELIDLLPQLSQAQAWVAEDLLFRLADGHEPPTVSLGSDETARKKARAAWTTWWQDHGAKVNLARISTEPALLGHTVIVLLDQNRILELDADNKIRWQVDNLGFPLDVQLLPGDRILVAEYNAGRVTERNLKGEVLWQQRVVGPLVAQRLANGNTFIVSDGQMIEVDRFDKQVFVWNPPPGHAGDMPNRIMKAMKLPSGEIVCLTSEPRVLRLDSNGKQLSSFAVGLGQRLFGGRIHMLEDGRVLVPHNGENKVVEYDAHGKVLWQVHVEQPIAATRLRNGNTLVTSMSGNRAVEFDQKGNEVWQYKTDTRVTRALRR